LGEQKFVVCVDAICGAGQVLQRGQMVSHELLGSYVEHLLQRGAIQPADEQSLGEQMDSGSAYAS